MPLNTSMVEWLTGLGQGLLSTVDMRVAAPDGSITDAEFDEGDEAITAALSLMEQPFDLGMRVLLEPPSGETGPRAYVTLEFEGRELSELLFSYDEELGVWTQEPY